MRKVTALLIAAALSGCVATSSRWNAPPTRNNTVAKRVKISSDAACSSAADCSYNGECTSGSCVCKPAFKGGACEQFNFEPLDVSQGVGMRTIKNGEQVSSWGGSVLLADDGKYHMWAAEMADSTGIKTWITNSQVVHAVADTPGKPFQFNRKELVWPVFAHEPTVARAPTGEYVMYYTTDYGEKPGSQCGPECKCGSNGTSCLSCPNDNQCSADPQSPLSTRMSFAKAPEGPWSTPVLVPAPDSGDTNLACIIRKDNSLMCLGRPGMGMMTADDWRNVSAYKWTNLDYGKGEDPMVWADEYKGKEVLHVVTHGGGWGDPYGYHYWSLDGGSSWSHVGDFPGPKVYENLVDMAGGGPQKILSRRERPHVVLDKDGKLIALTNGITEGWPCTAGSIVPDRPPCKHPPVPGVNPDCGPGSNGTYIWCPVDYCYTLYQVLKQ